MDMRELPEVQQEQAEENIRQFGEVTAQASTPQAVHSLVERANEILEAEGAPVKLTPKDEIGAETAQANGYQLTAEEMSKEQRRQRIRELYRLPVETRRALARKLRAEKVLGRTVTQQGIVNPPPHA